MLFGNHPSRLGCEVALADVQRSHSFNRQHVNSEGLIDTFARAHAENYLSHVWSMHLRLRENVHIASINSDPEAYHFGTSVYVSKEEAMDFLHDIWHQPLDEENEDLGYRPVICLQHGTRSCAYIVITMAWPRDARGAHPF